LAFIDECMIGIARLLAHKPDAFRFNTKKRGLISTVSPQ